MTKSAKSATKQTKVVRLKAWEPIFQALMTGQPVNKDVLENMLGELKYKLSAHILEIKIRSDAIIRVVKDGRKVVSYQLMNPTSAGVTKYWTERGIVIDTVKGLKDLNATPVEAETVAPAVETEKV